MAISYQKFDGFVGGSFAGSGPPVVVQATEMEPVAIRYGGFEAAGQTPVKPNRVIALKYASRPDALVSYLAGHATQRSRRLTRITTAVASETVRTYELTYGDEI